MFNQAEKVAQLDPPQNDQQITNLENLLAEVIGQRDNARREVIVLREKLEGVINELEKHSHA